MFKTSFLFSILLVIGVSTSCSKKKEITEKVFSRAQKSKIKGFDPILAGDLYSGEEVSRVYEGLLEFHYLKRPYKLQPNLASAMPTVSKDGLTYTFKLRDDVVFQNSAAFKGGKGRKLVAADVVYSIKRLADPKAGGLGWWLISGKIAGLDEWRNKHKKSKKTDYDEVIAGLKAIDSSTVQFKLKKPFPQFLYSFAMPYTYIVAKEVVEHFGEEFINNPVGTGPFITSTYTQSNKIVYTKNPTYRKVFYPTEGEAGDKEKGLLDDAGKQLPLIDKIVIHIQVEDQTRWLNFEKGKADFISVPKDNYDSVMVPGKGVSEAFAKKGISVDATPDLDVTYIAFNHTDPLFKNNVKLRQAMSLAYDRNTSNKLFYNGQGMVAQSVVPPGIAGYDKNYKNPYTEYNLEKAKKLLAEAGYPGGKGLPVIKYDAPSGSTHRSISEFFQKQMKKIGINIEFNQNTWPQLVKKVNTQQVQMFGMAWGADYPDAENFLQLLFGPNSAPGANGANYNNSNFNNIFKVATVMQDSPERTSLYKQLSKMAAEAVPWIFGVHRTKTVAKHSWFKNYKFTAFTHGRSKYLNLNLKEKIKNLDKL